MKKHTRLFALLTVFILAAEPAGANVGVPMIAVTMPGMIIGLIPVILIEALVMSARLKFRFWRGVRIMSFANIISTIIGIPVTWFMLAGLQVLSGGSGAYGLDTALGKILAVTWQAPWLIPYEDDLHWMVPAAILVLLIPFFFASWFIEYFIARRMTPDVDRGAVKRTVFLCNAATYALMEAGVAIWFVLSIVQHK